VPATKIILGVNDLQSQFPDIAKEAFGWNPETVTAGSHQKKHWECNLGHIWEASIKSRALLRTGCPVCSGRQVLAGFNDLKTKFPEIASESYGWDPTTVAPGTAERKNWKCNLGHIWNATPNDRTSSKTGCPVCSGRQVLAGFNDLQSQFPDISAEAYGWNPTTVSAASNTRKDWKCKEGHIYSALVYNRTGRGDGCPVCSGRQVLAGFNDLKTKFPDIASEAYGWDPTTVAPGTAQRKNWKCNKGHIYTSAVYSRTSEDGTGCPICAEYGYNPLKDAWFYLLQRPGEQQLGITNELEVRLKTHQRNGWTLIEHTSLPSNGQKVLDTERAFKKWLRKEIGLMEGTTENWSTTSMEVHSLAELKARSGIKTELF